MTLSIRSCPLVLTVHSQGQPMASIDVTVSGFQRVLKFQLGDELRRVRIDENEGGLSYDLVMDTAVKTWPEAAGNGGRIVAKYRDEDGDLCTLSAETFRDFMMLQLELNPQQKVLKLELYQQQDPDMKVDAVHASNNGRDWWQSGSRAGGYAGGDWKRGRHTSLSEQALQSAAVTDSSEKMFACARQGCIYLRTSRHTHCCRNCRDEGTHGPQCECRVGTAEKPSPCARPGCKFMRTFHATHCCRKCRYDGTHGMLCHGMPCAEAASPYACAGICAPVVEKRAGDAMNEAINADPDFQLVPDTLGVEFPEGMAE
eukprot:TRINITY_DN45467_c0_g1_i1.p1 TRINITY_DN45467_c0_g1~~TRINITY_DN45467_c0_g1_i1.p1  ORF type:complete len:323 (+),score=49.60 TRINITY_DN45467_c0_g1_i1:30-971(+)